MSAHDVYNNEHALTFAVIDSIRRMTGRSPRRRSHWPVVCSCLVLLLGLIIAVLLTGAR